MEKKRGQSAAPAAVLIVVIAILLVLFIAIMPPAERAELLGEETGEAEEEGSDTGEDIEEAEPEQNLLSVTPGRVDFLAQNEIEHPLPVINIFTRTETKVLAEKNVVYAKKSSFSEESSVFRFPVSNLARAENFLLSFDVREVKGRLIITLNDEEMFSAEIEGARLPLSLPKHGLKENNEIVFSASSPGIAFWATNEVSLENVKVVADITDVEAQSSKNTFLVSEMEKRNLEKVVLKFQPTCKYGEVGKLTIWVNGNEIYSGIPECDLAMVPIEFSSDLVYQGENSLVFRTERGTYLLSHVVIESELKEVEFPTYYFELSYEEHQAIKEGERRLRLAMDFVDVVTSKYGELVLNGHLIHFDTKEVNYVADVSEYIVQGNNALKIKPRKTLEIRELRVDLVK